MVLTRFQRILPTPKCHCGRNDCNRVQSSIVCRCFLNAEFAEALMSRWMEKTRHQCHKRNWWDRMDLLPRKKWRRRMALPMNPTDGTSAFSAAGGTLNQSYHAHSVSPPVASLWPNICAGGRHGTHSAVPCPHHIGWRSGKCNADFARRNDGKTLCSHCMRLRHNVCQWLCHRKRRKNPALDEIAVVVQLGRGNQRRCCCCCRHGLDGWLSLFARWNLAAMQLCRHFHQQQMPSFVVVVVVAATTIAGVVPSPPMWWNSPSQQCRTVVVDQGGGMVVVVVPYWLLLLLFRPLLTMPMASGRTFVLSEDDAALLLLLQRKDC